MQTYERVRPPDHPHANPDRHWVREAMATIEAEANRSADTHLLRFPLPTFLGVDLYLKDEATHPTGSLKHRLARSLVLHGITSGWIREGTTMIEASSGSTAVSEAYFAQLLGLPFVAIVPVGTSASKVEAIEHYGGEVILVATPASAPAECRRLALKTGGHFLDQFTHAESATDWRGNNNIAESFFNQLQNENHPIPRWIVVGAGTGGTSATVGRYVRYKGLTTQICVADPRGFLLL